MSNSLDPDQIQHFVSPDLGPKLQTVCKNNQLTNYSQRSVRNRQIVKKPIEQHFSKLVDFIPIYVISLLQQKVCIVCLSKCFVTPPWFNEVEIWVLQVAFI